MRKYVTLFTLAFHISCTFGQQVFPSGMIPVTGEITLKYTPSFDSRCTIKSYSKKSGTIFGDRLTQYATYSVFEERDILKLAMRMNVDTNYIRVVFPLNEDSGTFAAADPEFQTDMQMTADDRERLPQLAAPIFKGFKALFAATVGPSLKQGSSIEFGICEVLPEGTTQTNFGKSVVAGIATIRGRESLVVSTDQTSTCILPAGQFTMQSKGWQAFDRQSGLPAAVSWSTSLNIPGKGSVAMTDDRECEISGVLTKAASTQPAATKGKSVEQRLMELKSLLDKGLITQDNFEQKRLEILKTL